MLSRKILNAQKAILSILDNFILFPYDPLLPSSELNNENFLSTFGLLRGKNDNKKSRKKTNIWKIPYVLSFLFLKGKMNEKFFQSKTSKKKFARSSPDPKSNSGSDSEYEQG